MWGLIIVGLIFLLVYAPIGILLIIIGLIFWAVGRSKASKGLPTVNEKKCPKCAELVKAEARICRFCNHEFPSREIEVREEIEKCLTNDPNGKKVLSDTQLLDRIHDSYGKKEFEKCKYYCERVIQEYPNADYISFAKGRLEEMNIKLGIKN